jgi:hypothetical protein
MARVPGRLDSHIAAIRCGRQDAFGDELVEHSVKERGISGVKAQFASTIAGKPRL